MSNQDDSLPDDPFAEEETESSIEDLIREDQEDALKEDAILDNEQKQGRTKKIVLSTVGALAVCGVVVSAFFFNPFDNNNQVVGSGEIDKSNTSDNGGDNTDNDNDDTVEMDEDFFLDEGQYFPTEVKEWAQDSYAPEIESDISESVAETALGEEWAEAANLLPSEAAGYTSDDSKMMLEDGSINTSYSYWTAEVFQRESTIAIERLLNPTFGAWAVYQYPAYKANEEYNPSILSDLFTLDWEKRNEDKAFSEYVPIYADWNADNYGGQEGLLESGPRWYGEVVDSATEFVYDNESHQYTATVTANVKFTAWTKDQSTLEKNGVLTIKFVANSDSEKGELHKVLIDDASLKVDE